MMKKPAVRDATVLRRKLILMDTRRRNALVKQVTDSVAKQVPEIDDAMLPMTAFIDRFGIHMGRELAMMLYLFLEEKGIRIA